MKKIIVTVAVFVLLLTSGCAEYGARLASPKVYREFGKEAVSEARRQTAENDVITFDTEAYMARSRARHQAVMPLQEGEVAAVITEGPSEADIINENGYKDGLEVAFLSDSRQDIRVRIDDPHGQFFSFTITGGDTVVKKLEAGDFRVRSKRLNESRYRTDGTIRVFSDKRFHIDGKSYYGYAEFSGYGGW